ncbi:MAG TPA: NAD(P)-dependent oxidoreductase [Streptomyces sp.]|uniref:NAD-dependent epimerase/dehydratase family protein n=1 Tax=Streptomyces sp. TaxID=1931 RepID=UPI002D48E5B2|nr:NAD(P)-dependent oxidoreductase [Streptomyces sp.]HZG07257.1 NAD(P)-dependent oxidoreductase [Streptomyces sp.]
MTSQEHRIHTDATGRPVRLSGAVMTHPRRAEAARLLAETDTAGRVTVAVDPQPEGPPTALRSAAVAWRNVAPDATHHLVLQDDVVLAEGFFRYAERVAAAVPDEAVAFYAGWEGRTGAAVRLAALAGEQWTYAIEEHTPCLALMLPADAARGYEAFAAEHGLGWPYDVVMQRYLNALGVPVRVCVPNTVDHSEVPSIAGNSTHGWRQSAIFTDRAAEPTGYDCAQFAVVPFYQYGDARCAIRRGPDAEWEYIEAERYLRRIGLGERSRTAFAAADSSALPQGIARPVWETAFAMGVVVAGVTAEPPADEVKHAVMGSLGPGGLCEDYTAEELNELIPPVRELALVAFEAGRGARLGAAEPAATAREARARVAVTGGGSGFGRHLAGLLGDLGYHADHVAEPADAGLLDGAAYLVHLGSPADGPDRLSRVLSAAEKARIERVVYVGSAAVYRGSAEEAVTETSVTDPPSDPEARQWWHEEERCRRWGRETGTAVQVLRAAEPVGPGVHAEAAAAQWMHRAWTRRPLLLDKSRRHQVVDHRDLAGAIDAVLSAAPAHPVFNVASASYTEEELAELVALVARRTPWEELTEPGVRQGVMSTGLIETELRWRASAPLNEGLRALAQWLACDVHDAVTGLPQLGCDV